jgi:hypothetical protein
MVKFVAIDIGEVQIARPGSVFEVQFSEFCGEARLARIGDKALLLEPVVKITLLGLVAKLTLLQSMINLTLLEPEVKLTLARVMR